MAKRPFSILAAISGMRGAALAGVVTLHSLIVPVVVQASASIHVVWWLTAATTLIVRAGKSSGAVAVKE